MRKWVLATSLLVTAVFALSSCVFADDSMDILLNLLVNKNVITADEASSVRKEVVDIQKKKDAGKKTYSAESKCPVKISGYIQERYSQSPKTGFKNTFETKRARLKLSGDVSKNVDMNLQVDFAGSKSVLTSSTKSANMSKPLVVDGVIGYKMADGAKLSVGQFVIPFGYESMTSASALDTINRSQVTEALVPGRDNGSQGRDVGIQYAGTKKFGKCGVDYQVGVFNGSGINTTDDNNRKDLAGRVVLKPGIDGLSIGVAHYNGEAGAARVEQVRTGSELIYNRDPWTLKGEYIWTKDGGIHRKGWYTTLANKLSSRTQAVVRYDSLYSSTLTPHDPMNTLTLGLNYFVSKDGYQKWQLNYEMRNDSTVAVPSNLLMAQFQAGF